MGLSNGCLGVRWSLNRLTLTVALVLYCFLAHKPLNTSSMTLNSLATYLVNPLGKSTEVATTKGNLNRSPIIFIPGVGGSQLEARLNKTSVPHYVCSKVSDWFDLWLNIHLLVPGVIDCLSDNFILHYDNKTHTTHNTRGVEIRPTNFGSLDSVDYLDIYRLPGTGYFHNIISTLVKNNNYVPNVDMVGAGYDFRKAPNELADYFNQLKNLIESHYVTNNYRPITLICHSMGCLNSLYLLNQQTDNWKEIYVNRLIALAAPWSGSFEAVSAMLHGDNLGIPLLNKQTVQKLQKSYPSLMYLFPREPAFNKTRVLVETPSNNYTLENLDDLFVEAKMFDQREMWHITRRIANNLTAPNVELWCLYGTGYNTPSKIIYKDALDTNNYSETQGEGDGTVNLESLEACEQFSTQQKKPVHTRVFQNEDHIGILKGPKAANFISNFILEEDLI